MWNQNHDWLKREEKKREFTTGMNRETSNLEMHRCASTMPQVGQNNPKKAGVGGPFSHGYAVYKMWEHNGSMGLR